MPREIDRTHNHEEQEPVTDHANHYTSPPFIHYEITSLSEAALLPGSFDPTDMARLKRVVDPNLRYYCYVAYIRRPAVYTTHFHRLQRSWSSSYTRSKWPVESSDQL